MAEQGTNNTNTGASEAPSEVKSNLDHREAIAAKYMASLKGPEPVKSEGNTDSPKVESESAEAAPQEQPVGSSSVKEEAPKAKESKVPEGLVPKAALDEERSRRKELAKRTRELEQENGTFKQKMAEFEEKLKSLNKTDNEEAEPQDDVQRELAALRKEREEAQRRSQEEAQQKQTEQQSKTIASLDQKLEKEGFPGFELAVKAGYLQEELNRLYNDFEIEKEDADKPEVWERAFRTVYEEKIAKKFGLKKKEQAMEDKKAAKERANLATSPGKAPVVQKEEDRQLTQDELNRKYIQERQAAQRNLVK